MKGDGSGYAEVTPGRSGYDYARPSYSPDGSHIIAEEDTNFANDGGQHVVIMNADGSNERRVVDGGQEPTWSPDGQHFLASLRGPTYRGVWSFTLDGSRQQLFPGSVYTTGEASVADWQPCATATGCRTTAPKPKPKPKCRPISFVGLTLRSAEQWVGLSHCSVGRVIYVKPGPNAYSHERGTVIGQSRKHGALLPNGTRIDLIVSNGK